MVMKWFIVPCLFLVISSTFVFALDENNENNLKASSNEAVVSNSTLSSVNSTSGDANNLISTALPTIPTTKSTG